MMSSMSRHRDPALQGLEVETRPDGKDVYRASIRIQGTSRKARGPWRDRPAVARGDYVKLLRQRDAGEFDLPAEDYPTVGQAFDDWFRKAENGIAWARGGRAYAPKTLRDYKQAFDQYLRGPLGGVQISRVRRTVLQGLIDDIACLHSGQRARNVRSSIAALYNHLLPRYDFLADPTHGLDLPAGSKRRMVIIAPDHMQQLIAQAGPMGGALLGIAGVAGLRHGEIKALAPADIDLEGRWITVAEAWDAVEGRKDPKSDAGTRRVPIFGPLLPLLEIQLRVASPTCLFPSPRNPERPADLSHALSGMRLAWSTAGFEGIPDLHSARHTFASHLMFAGFDVVTVAEWCGHAQASMTLNWYAKSMQGMDTTPDKVLRYLSPPAELMPRELVLA